MGSGTLLDLGIFCQEDLGMQLWDRCKPTRRLACRLEIGICRVWLNDVECAAAINLKAHAPRRVGLETPETAPVAAILLLCFVLINPLHIFSYSSPQ